MKYHIFISYPEQDYEIAHNIYKHFSPRFKVFVDKITLKSGDEWSIEIPNAQKNSVVSLIVVSQNTYSGFYEQEEIARAIMLKRKTKKHIIIPVLVKKNNILPDIPYGLQNIQNIVLEDIYNLDYLHRRVSEAIMPMIESFGYEHKVEIVEKPERKEWDYSKEDFDKNDFFNETDILNYFLNGISRYSYKSIFFFAFIDLDKFTQINTIYGKKCGDRILKEVEQLIRSVYKPILIQRLVSDEFCIVIPKCNVEQGIQFMENLQEMIFLFNWNEISYGLFVSASIGVCELNLKRELTILDVKEGLIRAAIGCKNCKNTNNDDFIREQERSKDVKERKKPRYLIDNKEYDYLSLGTGKKRSRNKRILKGPAHLSKDQESESIFYHCS